MHPLGTQRLALAVLYAILALAKIKLEVNGQLHVVENVPARVNLDTGEEWFAPATVEHLRRLIWESKQPARIMQAPVYKYA
jgi:hypothetical protein